MPSRRLLHVFPSFAIGGGQQVRFATLANQFGRQYKHLVVSMNGAIDGRKLLAADVDCEFINAPDGKGSVLQNANRFRRVLKQLRPDLLLTYNWGTIEWSLANYLRICPHVHFEDGFGPEEADMQLLRRVLTRRLVLSRATKVVVCSRVLHDIATRQWRLPERKLRYVPTGIDTRPYRAPPDRDMIARLGLSLDRPLVGTLGGLRPEKNLARLIRAFRIVRGQIAAQLLIIGKGPELNMLEGLCRELQVADDVVFAGYVDDVNGLLTALDVFAISSDTEQLPTTVLEAMAAALPIAGVRVGDVKEMVSDSNAPFIVDRDETALAQSIQLLLSSADERRRIGHLNRERVEQQFNSKTFLSSFDEIYQTT